MLIEERRDTDSIVSKFQFTWLGHVRPQRIDRLGLLPHQQIAGAVLQRIGGAGHARQLQRIIIMAAAMTATMMPASRCAGLLSSAAVS